MQISPAFRFPFLVLLALLANCNAPEPKPKSNAKDISPFTADSCACKTQDKIWGDQLLFSDTIRPDAPLMLEYDFNNCMVKNASVYIKTRITDTLMSCVLFDEYLNRSNNGEYRILYPKSGHVTKILDLREKTPFKHINKSSPFYLDSVFILPGNDTILHYDIIAPIGGSCTIYGLYFHTNGKLFNITRTYEPIGKL